MRADHIRWTSYGDAHESNSTHRYLPVMIGRLMLSLKKAADNSKVGWSLTCMTRPSSPGAYTWKRSYRVQFAAMYDEDAVSPTDGDIPLAAVLSPMP